MNAFSRRPRGGFLVGFPARLPAPFGGWLPSLAATLVGLALLAGHFGPGLLSPEHQRGIRHHRAGRLDEAVALYRVALQRDPGNPTIRFNLAAALQGLGQTDEARGLLAEVLGSGSPELVFRAHHNLALIQLGEALQEEGPARSAPAVGSIADGKAALRISSSSPETRWNLELAMRIGEETGVADSLTRSGDSDSAARAQGTAPASTARGPVSNSSLPAPGLDPNPSTPSQHFPIQASVLAGERLLQAFQSEEAAALYRLLRSRLGRELVSRSVFDSKERGPPW